jgi:chemotaxis protein methyltransferase CheR
MNIDASGLTTAQLAEFAAFAGEQLGLSFPADRLSDLARGVERAATNLRYQNPVDFLRRLNQTQPEPHALDMLASQLTVGETYFFRERSCFDVLRERILPDIIRARRTAGELRLKLWSAGCCTGEEPYSLAILLDSLIPDLAQWDVTLLATDVNRTFLNIAKQGIYGDWSFRGLSQGFKERFFNSRPDGRFELKKHIRDRVTFSYLNLARDDYPSPAGGIHTMDLILCRNVLMYLVPSRARAIAQHLERTLVDGGWLALGSTELMLDLFGLPVNMPSPGTALFQKTCSTAIPLPIDKAGVTAIARAIAASTDGDGQSTNLAYTATFGGFSEDKAKVHATSQPSDAFERTDATNYPPGYGTTPAALARSHADRGKHLEALAWADRALASDKLDPANHYLRANILLALGDRISAITSLERAIFLDRDFALAHFTLGVLARSKGRQTQARRYFDNTLSIIAQMDPHQIVAESDGMTAGRLGEIIRSLADIPDVRRKPRTTM